MRAAMRRVGGRPMIVACIAACVVATSTAIAAAGPLEDQLARTNKQKGAVRAQLSDIGERQQRVLSQIEKVNTKINELTIPINDLSARISDLNARIQHRQDRIVQLRVEFIQQKREIINLDGELGVAQDRLAARLVAVYKNGDQRYAWLAGIHDMRDMFDRKTVVTQVATRDNQIAANITSLQQRLRDKRARNSDLREDMRSQIASITADRSELEGARARLESKRAQLAVAKAGRDSLLTKYDKQEQALHNQMDHLDEDSAVLKKAIESGATSFGGGVPAISSGGLMWPVNGPVVSRFGMRWGRMHEGWDIAVPAGVPIHAAQSGIVTYAGWMSGYGNLVVIQHAGSLSTAYGHQSRLGSSVGQVVVQGQVIGFVGCTGHCFGDHVHFETRINGNAVDPDNYL